MPGKKIEENIVVKAYSGYKANERPVDFIIGDKKVEIVDIINCWVEPDRDCFKVKGINGKIYCLYWLREDDVWQAKEKC